MFCEVEWMWKDGRTQRVEGKKGICVRSVKLLLVL